MFSFPTIREYLPGPPSESISRRSINANAVSSGRTLEAKCLTQILLQEGSASGSCNFPQEDDFGRRSRSKRRDSGLARYLAQFAVNGHLYVQEVSDMQRMKVGDGAPPQRPAGNWLAGMVIGSAIMTMATQAVLIGTAAAIRDSTLKGG
jgi:hypothetical protein